MSGSDSRRKTIAALSGAALAVGIFRAAEPKNPARRRTRKERWSGANTPGVR